MPYRLLYFYWKIHTWSEESGARQGAPNDPMPGVMLAFSTLSFFNIMSILYLVHIFFGINSTEFIDWAGVSRIRWFLVIFCPWTIAVYGLLKISKIKEKAFSTTSIQIYRERKYGVSFIFIYIVLSFTIFLRLGWIEGGLKK
jgi:hypothetical protein